MKKGFFTGGTVAEGLKPRTGTAIPRLFGDIPKMAAGDRVEPPLTRPENTTSATGYILRGYHALNGRWVNLWRFDTPEEAADAVRACNSRTQPVKDKLCIVWEEFSAFQIEMLTEVR